ncbi:MAG: acyl-CoA thioesterase [Prevotellaceae bacterium]|jgi:acyl-CoA thioester hydrolase|nr:acyl-CoA thioesterase [Prevotellaceae bacterium]
MLTTPVQIRFSDVDSFGHVNNSVYWSYFDVGRMDYLHTLFSDDFELRDETVVLVHAEADYKVQTRLKDAIDVRTSVVGVGERSLKMRQEIVNTKTGAVHVSSYSVLSGFSKATQKSIPIKLEWKNTIERFEHA